MWFFRNAPVKLHPVALVRGVTFAHEANAAWTIRVAVRHPAVVHVFEVETVRGPGTARRVAAVERTTADMLGARVIDRPEAVVDRVLHGDIDHADVRAAAFDAHSI